MPPIDPFQLKIMGRLAAIELVLIDLARAVPALRTPFETFETRHPQGAVVGAVEGKPELTDLLKSEIQEALEELLQRMLSPD
jgi:hypothetical protein